MKTAPAPKSPGLPPQPEFDYTHHLPAGMESFTVRYLAAFFGTSHRHWINLVDLGELKALDLSRPGASKAMMRIPRAELTRYLNSRLQ